MYYRQAACCLSNVTSGAAISGANPTQRRAVHGLDATAAQTFGTLFNMLESLGVELVITHMENPESEKLLRAHGVIGADCCMCACSTSATAPWVSPSHTLLMMGQLLCLLAHAGVNHCMLVKPMFLTFLAANANICKSRTGVVAAIWWQCCGCRLVMQHCRCPAMRDVQHIRCCFTRQYDESTWAGA